MELTKAKINSFPDGAPAVAVEERVQTLAVVQLGSWLSAWDAGGCAGRCLLHHLPSIGHGSGLLRRGARQRHV